MPKFPILICCQNGPLGRLVGSCRKRQTAPNNWGHHARSLNNQIMSCCRANATTATWQRLLIALGNAEADLLRNPRATAAVRLNPLVGLSPQWIVAAGDQSAELRLAVLLASECGPRREEHKLITRNTLDPLRRHWMPLKQNEKGIVLPHRFAMSDESLSPLAEVIACGTDLVADLTSLVQRRLQMLGRRNDWHHLPIVPLKFLSAQHVDVQRRINAELDDAKIMALTRSLMSVDWRTAWELRDVICPALGIDHPVPEVDPHRFSAWAAIRMCFHWKDIEWSLQNTANPEGFVRGKFRVVADPAIFQNLVGGHPQRAIELASRRLRASGLPIRVARVLADRRTSQRWAASLAWCLSDYSLTRVATSIVHRAGVDSSQLVSPEA